MSDQERIAAGIAAELARRGKTKSDLAKPLGLSAKSVYSRFHGKTNFTTDELSAVAGYLHLSFMDLMRRCIGPDEEKSPVAAGDGETQERKHDD